MTTKNPERLIRLYRRDDEGNLWATQETLTVEDLAGSVPPVGDLIVSRWLQGQYEDYLEASYS